jgi:hypothetical protein
MKTFFTTLLLAFGSVALAQIQKGQNLTSGSVGVSFAGNRIENHQATSAQTYEPNDYYSLSMKLNRGWFIRDGLLLGGSLGIGYQNVIAERTNVQQAATVGGATITTNSYSMAVLLRKYWSVTDQLFVYAGGGLSGSTSRTAQTAWSTANGGAEERTFRIGGTYIQPTGQVGAMYRLANRLALEANVTTSGFPINVNGISLGLVVLSGSMPKTGMIEPCPLEAAQTQKGRWVIGATATIGSAFEENSVNNTSNSNSSATTGILVGQFIRNNVLAGLGVDYTASRSGSVSATGPVNYSLAFRPFVRSYVGTNQLRPYWQIGANYLVNKPAVTNTVGAQQVGVGIGVGFAYMLGKRFIVQTSLASLDTTYEWFSPSDIGTQYSTLSIAARGSLGSGFALYYVL